MREQVRMQVLPFTKLAIARLHLTANRRRDDFAVSIVAARYNAVQNNRGLFCAPCYINELKIA